MDELLHHCLRELSFDGDLGCSASRLKEFIEGYHTHSGSRQTVDDAFCSFVWSLIVQKPTVVVGTLPAGADVDVAVAPQARKGKKGEEGIADAPRLQLLDAKSVPFAELIAQSGDALRLAADPETTFAAITGSHIRPPKLTPMVYTVLQLITRGREKGASTVVIGKTTGYDQKTVHYILNQLINLDLVLKLRQGGTAQNVAIHKYFYERSDYWKDIREEASRLDSKATQDDADMGVPDDDDDDLPAAPSVQLGAFDDRHLSSLPIVRARIIELLSKCTNNVHSTRNLLVSMGYVRPPKSDRRFFATQLEKLVTEGTLELVEVRTVKKNISHTPGERWLRCVRLAQKGSQATEPVPEGEASSSAVINKVQEVQDAFADIVEGTNEGGLAANKTVHRQMRELIEGSGTRGMTQNNVTSALGEFDSRAIELQLGRLESTPLPPHLADQAVVDVIENHGRQRRHRYYDLAAYKELVPDDARHCDVDLSAIGEFPPVDEDSFYENDNALDQHVDALIDGASASTAPRKKQTASKRKRVNPILPDGTVKKGRPRKNPDAPPRPRKSKPALSKDDSAKSVSIRKGAAGPSASRSTKRKRDVDEAGQTTHESSSVAKKRRGSSRYKAKDAASGETEAGIPAPTASGGELEVASPAFAESCPATISEVAPALAVSPADTPMDFLDAVETGGLYVVGDTRRDPPEVNVVEEAPAPSTHHGVQAYPPALALTNANDEPGIISISLISGPAASTAATEEESHAPATGSLVDARGAKSAQKVKGPGRTNISHLLREQEFVELLHQHDGVMATNVREFYEAHAVLVERKVGAGSQASTTPGTRPDKRTVDTTFNKLETKGTVKIVKTSVRTTTGGSKPIVVAYLSELDTDKLNAFLSNLGRAPFPVHQPVLRRIHDCIDYATPSVHRPAMPLAMLHLVEPGDQTERWTRNTNRADKLFAYDDDTIRDVLLAETSTLAQLSGFIVPKSSRARELHVMTVRALQSPSTFPSIVSKQHRILHLSFYHRDLSVGDYCRVVSALVRSDDLIELLGSPEGRATALRDLPKSLYDAMQVNRARSRARILDGMEILRSLNLVTPLQPSTSITPWITCPANGDHPTAFDPAPLEGWTFQTPSVAPVYWRVSPIAPLHLWSLSEHAPPFWKDVSVQAEEECAAYWFALREISLSHEIARTIPCPATGGSGTGPLRASSSGTVCIRRAVSWKDEYILTWHQEQFIRRAANYSRTADDATREAELQRLCRITCAPREVVADFLQRARDSFAMELEKARSRARGTAGRTSKSQNAAKAVLAQRSAMEKEQRSAEWTKLVERVHPDAPPPPLAARFRRLRTKFLVGFSTDQRPWEEAIAQAVKDAELARPHEAASSADNRFSSPFKLAHGLSSRSNPFGTLASNPSGSSAPPVVNVPERSVQAIIESMGPPLKAQGKPKKKKKPGRKRKNRDTDAEPSEDDAAAEHQPPEAPIRATRRRVVWTSEYDELARDTSAIIRARCRGLGWNRIDWGGLDQVFPSVPRNSVRHRIQKYVEQPGEADYLVRLESRWYELWLQYRGSEQLPDGNPRSLTDFPIVVHIEFLRKHIDKRALRIGFVEAEETTVVTLPGSLGALGSAYSVLEKSAVTPTFDFLWNSLIDEGREKGLAVVAFSPWVERMPEVPEGRSRATCIAESTLKMVLGTPNAVYDPDRASAMLHSVGEQPIAEARAALLARGVISNLVHDPKKPRPGRTLRFTDMNERAMSGPMNEDLFADAAAFEENADIVAQGQQVSDNAGEPTKEWDEWSLSANDGDMAAFLGMVSENKLDFKVDISHSRAQREVVDWNSKKTDDEQIESLILYRRRPDPARNDTRVVERAASSPLTHLPDDFEAEPSASSPSVTPAPMALDDEPAKEDVHGKNVDGAPASCKLKTQYGLIDCEACVIADTTAFIDSLSDEDRTIVEHIINLVAARGPDGFPEDDLMDMDKKAATLLDGVMDAEAPPVLRVGYAVRTLVAAAHVSAWTVVVREEPLTRTLPRRWRDIHGMRLPRTWTAARRAVVGLAVLHPGISQAELRWRLRAVYDGQEVDELVRTLHREGTLALRRVDGHCEPVEWSKAEEVFVFPSEVRPWYNC